MGPWVKTGPTTFEAWSGPNIGGRDQVLATWQVKKSVTDVSAMMKAVYVLA